MILCLGVHQELSPQKDDQALEEVPSPTGFPLSPDRLHAIEEVIAKGRSPHHEQQDTDELRALPADPSAHLSPFHKARKHFKNIMGGLSLSDLFIEEWGEEGGGGGWGEGGGTFFLETLVAVML